MPRSLWNGTISVGVIAVPVKLYTAVESKTVRFREVHLEDGAKIEHRRCCAKEEKEVPYDDVVKGFEVGEGKFVVLEKDEIAAAAGDPAHVIDVESFVETTAIDPVFYAKTYYLGAAAQASGGSRSTTASTWPPSARSTASSGCTRCTSPTRWSRARRSSSPSRRRLRRSRRSRWRASWWGRSRRPSRPASARTATARRSWT